MINFQFCQNCHRAHERRAYATRVLDIVIQTGDFPALAALHDAAVRHVRLILDT